MLILCCKKCDLRICKEQKKNFGRVQFWFCIVKTTVFENSIKIINIDMLILYCKKYDLRISTEKKKIFGRVKYWFRIAKNTVFENAIKIINIDMLFLSHACQQSWWTTTCLCPRNAIPANTKRKNYDTDKKMLKKVCATLRPQIPCGKVTHHNGARATVLRPSKN